MAHVMFTAVKHICDAEHFRPFVIIMDNDERIEIQHREFVMPVKGFEWILVQRPEDPEARLLSPEHIREVTRPHPHSAAA
jgi:hypothetical protein